MSAFLIITAEVEPNTNSANPSLKIDRQFISAELQRVWPSIEISVENDKDERVRWELDVPEGNVWKTLLEGEIFFSHNDDCVIIDAHSSAPYVAKFASCYRGIVPEIYRLSVGNDWGGPKDQFDLISGMSETEIYNQIRDWVND